VYDETFWVAAAVLGRSSIVATLNVEYQLSGISNKVVNLNLAEANSGNITNKDRKVDIEVTEDKDGIYMFPNSRSIGNLITD
jgi:hypothetical protein